MESLVLSFEAIMPIFILLMLGYVLKLSKIVSKENFDAINKLVFKVFLPTLLFYNIYKTSSMQTFSAKLIIFVAAGVLLVYIIGSFIVRAVTKDNAKRSVILQGFFRSNYAILGIPLVEYVCRGNSTGLASLLVAVIIPLFNVLAVICLESYRKGKVNILSLLKGIIMNPLIIGCILGAVFFISGIRLPEILEASVADVSKIASPLSIIVLGANFEFSSIKGYLKELIITVSMRLVIIPFFAVTAAVMLGFRGEALACILVIFGAPIAISSFAMTQQMGGDEKLSAQSIILSSAFCLLTLFVWIFVLNYLGLFWN